MSNDADIVQELRKVIATEPSDELMSLHRRQALKVSHHLERLGKAQKLISASGTLTNVCKEAEDSH
jgi:hypothetical protein